MPNLGPRTALPGERFGKLLVLEHLPPKRRLCQCDCGNQATPRGSSLVNGDTRSCGCERQRYTRGPQKLKEGEQLGRLRIVYQIHQAPRAQDVRWVTLCATCGRRRILREDSIIETGGKCRSCDHTGRIQAPASPRDRVGQVTLIKPTRGSKWLVRCDCGATFETRLSDRIRRKSLQCARCASRSTAKRARAVERAAFLRRTLKRIAPLGFENLTSYVEARYLGGIPLAQIGHELWGTRGSEQYADKLRSKMGLPANRKPRHRAALIRAAAAALGVTTGTINYRVRQGTFSLEKFEEEMEKNGVPLAHQEAAGA